MDIIVTGGTGFVGSALCTELDERGHDVTALSRSPDRGDLPESISLAEGDVRDVESLREHFEGMDAVVNLVALAPMFKPDGGDDMHFRVHLDGTKNVIEAAEAREVPYLLQMSALGADPDGETAYIRSKGEAEKLVRDSELAWTIFQPSVIFGDGSEFQAFTKMLTTPYVTALPGGGKTRFQPVYIGDIIPMMADAVEDEDHWGETYEIVGPQVLTLAEVAKLLYRAEGKSLTVLPVPMALSRIGLALADPVPFVPFGTDQYRSLQFDNTRETSDVDAFGRSASDLTTFAAYLDVS